MAMTTILPEAPPPRPPLAAARFALPRARGVAYVLAVVLVGLALAAGARAWTGRLPAPDKPGGSQRALTTWAGLPASGAMPAFRIKVPREPRHLGEQPGGSPNLMTVTLGDDSRPTSGALLFVRFDEHATARESIEAVGGGDGDDPGPIRDTSVAGRRAYTRDVSIGQRVVHEYRFGIDDRVYGFGILCYRGDDACRDTGLAAMATFEIG